MLAITFTMAIVGVLAVAQALVAMSGGIIDLSQPAALTLSASIVAQLLELGMPIPVAVVAGILAGAAWGFMNALIIVYGKLNPIIVTLATNFIGTAAMILIYQTSRCRSPSDLADLRQDLLPRPSQHLVADGDPRSGRRLSSCPAPAMAATSSRSAAAASRRRPAASRSGKPASRIFTLSGAIVGLAGVLFAASNGPFSPNAGTTFQLPVIAGIILAGVSLAGGRGSIWLILLSIGFLATVPTSLVFFGFSSNWQAVFQGIILIIAVAIDGWRARKGQR